MLSLGENTIDHQIASPAHLRGRLSPRQLQVLDGILAGKPNKVIAQDLILSIRTVEAHRATIMSKIGVSSVAELVRATSLSSITTESLDVLSRIYPGLVSYWDSRLIAKYANSPHESVLGRPVDDILGKSMSEVLGPAYLRRSLPFIRGVLGGQPQHFIHLMRTAAGPAVTYCAVYSPQFDALGRVNGFFAFMMDINGQESEAGTAGPSLEDETDRAEMILDETSRIVSVNDVFTDVTHFTAEEVRGRTPMMIKPLGIEAAAFMTFWADVLAERYWQGTVWYRRRDGYLFRSHQKASADGEGRGQVGCRVVFSEIKVP